MGASIVAGDDATPVPELGEKVLDLVPLVVEPLVRGKGFIAAPRRGNAGLDASGGQRLAEPSTVLAPLGDQASGRRRGIEDKASTFVIAHPPHQFTPRPAPSRLPSADCRTLQADAMTIWSELAAMRSIA